jgi:hypothetical protein
LTDGCTSSRNHPDRICTASSADARADAFSGPNCWQTALGNSDAYTERAFRLKIILEKSIGKYI